MYYSYIEIEYVATSFSPARMDLALKLLTQALKGKSNAKGLEQLEALKKLENILNNTPETAPIPIESPPPNTRWVTFKWTAKPSQGETEPEDAAPSARMNEPIPQTRTAIPIHTATIDKPIANTLTPRVQKIPTSKDNNPTRLNDDNLQIADVDKAIEFGNHKGATNTPVPL
jgi:hypothetical protein